jgi:hypothetical protein
MDLEKTPIWKKVTGIATFIGVLAAGIAGFTSIADYIDAVVEEKVQEKADPLIRKRMNQKVDSIFKIKKVSFREILAKELGIEKDDVVDTLSNWYKREKGIQAVGLFKSGRRLYYRDVDGQVYQPIIDQENDKYYFHDARHRAKWCK